MGWSLGRQSGRPLLHLADEFADEAVGPQLNKQHFASGVACVDARSNTGQCRLADVGVTQRGILRMAETDALRVSPVRGLAPEDATAHVHRLASQWDRRIRCETTGGLLIGSLLDARRLQRALQRCGCPCRRQVRCRTLKSSSSGTDPAAYGPEFADHCPVLGGCYGLPRAGFHRRWIDYLDHARTVVEPASRPAGSPVLGRYATI